MLNMQQRWSAWKSERKHEEIEKNDKASITIPLSYSEEAIGIFDELNADEGLLVARKLRQIGHCSSVIDSIVGGSAVLLNHVLWA